MKIQYNYRKKSYAEEMTEATRDNYLAFEKVNRHWAYYNHLELIKHKKFFISQSETNGRVNHNLTNIPTKLLGLLLLEEDSLCEIDLKCSQPTILAHLIINSKNDEQEEE